MLPSVYLTMKPPSSVETRNVGQQENDNNHLDQPIYEKIVSTVEIDRKNFYDSYRICRKELVVAIIAISFLIIGETK